MVLKDWKKNIDNENIGITSWQNVDGRIIAISSSDNHDYKNTKKWLVIRKIVIQDSTIIYQSNDKSKCLDFAKNYMRSH